MVNEKASLPEEPGNGETDAAEVHALVHPQPLHKPKPAPPSPPLMAPDGKTKGEEDAKVKAQEEAKAKAEQEEKTKRQARLLAARRQRARNKVKPFYFVMITIGMWWLVWLLSDLVITCVPGGEACRLPYLVNRVFAIFAGPPPMPGKAAAAALTKYEWPLLVVALLAALWVAKAKVYPASDATDEFTEDELAGNS